MEKTAKARRKHLGLNDLLNTYDKGKKLSGSNAGGEMAMQFEYAINHKPFYDPLLEVQEVFEKKKKLCKTVGHVLDAYINKMEEEKDLVEYRKFYDENGTDEKLWELLKNYEETREATRMSA
ncbi:hypothetical protein niasHT_008476 [Heterodera trifolii]|uniref:Uncharacterized protein n=1 Tax=Heterodera trifolii TaxID=157864 RepID=A0ABD2M5S9_9BILA